MYSHANTVLGTCMYGITKFKTFDLTNIDHTVIYYYNPYKVLSCETEINADNYQ